MAQPFDVERGELRGEATLVADSVLNPEGIVGYALSSAGGLLVYQAKSRFPQGIWVDRRGATLDSLRQDNTWSYRLSHDGTRVAQAGFGLWVRDLRRGVALRLAASYDAEREVLMHPVWAPDDARVAFAAVGRRGKTQEIRVEQADGTGPAASLPAPEGGGLPLDWSPDGSMLLVAGVRDASAMTLSLWLVHTRTRAVTRWLAVSGNVPAARFSPDGRWVAYQSDETGSPEVYLRPFPGPGAPVRVSPAGGGRPAWRADGRELFYLTPAGDLVTVAVAAAGAGRPLDVGPPAVLVRAATPDPFSLIVTPYDLAPDGRRVMLNPASRAASPLTLLAPWSRGRQEP
jgi:Tol biopolymer transport system component